MIMRGIAAVAIGGIVVAIICGTAVVAIGELRLRQNVR